MVGRPLTADMSRARIVGRASKNPDAQRRVRRRTSGPRSAGDCSDELCPRRALVDRTNLTQRVEISTGTANRIGFVFSVHSNLLGLLHHPPQGPTKHQLLSLG